MIQGASKAGLVGSRSVRKGAAFERQFCKLLSRALSKNQHEHLFRRSEMSGGVATRKGLTRGSAGVAGDVVAGAVDYSTDEGKKVWSFMQKYVVELKNRADLSVDVNFLIKRKGMLWDVWNQHRRLGRMVGKTPILVFSNKIGGKYVLLEEKSPNLISGRDGVVKLTDPVRKDCFFLIHLEEFLKAASETKCFLDRKDK